MALYPPIRPYNTGFLAVGSGHRLYVEQSGNPEGLPVVCVHGGPGGGAQPSVRQFFDPARFRIIAYDQRGAGQSTWSDQLAANTTLELVRDLSRLRQALGVARWLVFGGSWGVALSLAYASTSTSDVLGLVLRGVFLGERRDIDWLYRAGGASRFFPNLWRDLAAPLGPVPSGQNIARRLEERLASRDRAVRFTTTVAAQRWAATLAQPYRSGVTRPLAATRVTDADVAQMRLKFHYYARDCFLSQGWLRAQLPALRATPVAIINGEADAICPAANARGLARALPLASLSIVRGGGHSPTQPDMAEALVDAVRACAAQAVVPGGDAR